MDSEINNPQSTFDVIAFAQKFERDYPDLTVEQALLQGVLTLKAAELIVNGQFAWEDIKRGVDTEASDYDNSYYATKDEGI